MTKNNIFKRSICLVLLLSILLSAFSVLPTFAQGDEYHLDYSDPNDDFNISVSPSELLSLLYPTSEISTAEAEYVDTYIQQVLLYNENNGYSLHCTRLSCYLSRPTIGSFSVVNVSVFCIESWNSM